MADTSIHPEIYAVIGAALLGALIGQFLSFYRQKRQDYEELKSIIRLISLLDEQEIQVKIDYEDSFLWYLREELFRSYKQNILYLDDAGPAILNLIRQFPDPSQHQPSGYLDEHQLKEDAAHAFQILERMSWLKTVWLTILGFIGLSQMEHGDRLEAFLAEEDLELAMQQVDDQQFDSTSGEPVLGYVIPNSRLGKIFIAWFASFFLIVASSVGILLGGAFTPLIESALVMGAIVITIVFFGIYTLIQSLGVPIKADDLELGDD